MIKKILIGVISAILLLLSFVGGYLTHYSTQSDELKSLEFVIDMYKAHYYEEADNIVGLMTEGLVDQYSRYMTKEEYELFNKSAEGVRIGIGVSVSKLDNTIATISGNSPAYKAGVKVGSTMIGVKGVNDTEYKSITDYNSFFEELSNFTENVDFDFKLSLNGEEYVVTLAREQYNESYVFYQDLTGSYTFLSDSFGDDMQLSKLDCQLTNEDIPSDTAYLKYTQFNGTLEDINGSVGQIDSVMNLFKQNGNTNIVIDLRGNGGGYMHILTDVARHFVAGENGDKKLVSMTVDKNDVKTEYTSGTVDYNDYGFENIVMLVDSGTASASEALVGAVMDYDKESCKNIASVIISPTNTLDGVVYRSYGKGIMQTTFYNFLSGEAVKLTTAGIFWPVSNTTIHNVGITKSLGDMYINIANSADKTVDSQLSAGLDICKVAV